MVDAETQYSIMEQTTLALKKCHSEAPPIPPSSSSDCTHKPTTLSYPAQIGFIRTNVEMGHRLE